MVIKQDFYYPIKNSNRTLHIYLPNDYYHSNERYPVMYFFDGHNMFSDSDATYGKSWGMANFLDGYDKKFIIVGLECSHTGFERLEEYCPYNKRFKGQMLKGIGEYTMQWLVNEIKPYIDANFRTYPHREATGIGGSSMGGIMTTYALLKYSHIFSKGAALSPCMFWNISNHEKTLWYAPYQDDSKLYFGWGEIEAGKAAYNKDPEYHTKEARAIRKFEKELQSKNYQTYLYFQREGRHTEADWEKQIPIFMNYLWK